MTRQVRRILICGAVALAGGFPPSPLSASNPVAPAPASLCVAPDVANADVVASHDRCARERRRERRMCRRYGFLSMQCLNAWIETARCEGRFVDSGVAPTSMGAVRGPGLVRLLDEGAHDFRYAVIATRPVPPPAP